MPSTISYSINGKACSGEEYLELIEKVFNRKDPDVEQIALNNGEMVSLAGNEAYVSIQHLKNDGTIWTGGKITKQDAATLLEAFIHGNEEILSHYGTSLLSKTDGGTNIFTESEVAKIARFLFKAIFSIGIILFIIWAVTGKGDASLVAVPLMTALVFLFMIGGIDFSIKTFKYQKRNAAKKMPGCSNWHVIAINCIRVVSVLLVFLFAVILPLSILISMVQHVIHIFRTH